MRFLLRLLSFVLPFVICGCGLDSKPADVIPNENPGAGAPQTIPQLIHRLKSESDDKAYYTAIELAKFKKAAVPALIEGLASSHAGTRKWCARTLTNIVGGFDDNSGRPDAESAGPHLLTALARERNPAVSWYMVQAIGKLQPDSEAAIKVLIGVLPDADTELQSEVLSALRQYGERAVSLKPALMALLKTIPNDSVRESLVETLSEVGITEADARVLSRLPFPASSRSAAATLMVLLKYPELALSFLKVRPKLMQEESMSWRNTEPLFKVMTDSTSKTAALRSYLRQREDLPTTVMVYLGSPEFLLRIQQRIAAADQHSRTFLQAVARSLGEEPDRVIEISEDHAGGFKPKSAHPGSDEDRWAESNGHGDGATLVLITGRLLMRDGSPAVEPHFYQTNDRMLLGERIKALAPLIRYDQQTGRFVFLTTVFAAYSIAEGQKEPGPYQTGPADTLIEAQGARSLKVTFYDEMPDVKIILSRIGDEIAPEELGPEAVQPPKAPNPPRMPNPIRGSRCD